MTAEVGGMIGAGVAALVVGLALARRRFAGASGAGKILALGPVFEAVPLAVFAAEHFTAARELAPIVPHWLPWPLFWTYFVGTALLAAAISFIVWRHVRWSAALLALLFLIIVVTIDLPNMPKHLHDRIFWTLTVRETVFAGGAMVLAGSVWPRGKLAGAALERMGRVIVGAVMIFYGIEHFLFPRFVTGVPLEKATPAWCRHRWRLRGWSASRWWLRGRRCSAGSGCAWRLRERGWFFCCWWCAFMGRCWCLSFIAILWRGSIISRIRCCSRGRFCWRGWRRKRRRSRRFEGPGDRERRVGAGGLVVTARCSSRSEVRHRAVSHFGPETVLRS